LIEQAGGQALAVTSAEDVRAALERLVAWISPSTTAAPTPPADITTEEWDRVLDVHLRGVFLCMKHEIPLMLKQGGAIVVNTGSGASVIGIAGQAAYCAAKWD
jgi:NAD(P)-dependent dehydrogenase (short-subunit alcohol dehydrogenase family)